MSNDTTDALVGAITVAVMVGLAGAFYVLPKKSGGNELQNIVEKTVEAIATVIPTALPTVEPVTKPSEILGNPKTVASIFDILKETTVTEDQFNGMFAVAGIKELPDPPAGWQYFKNKTGIGLKKLEDMTKGIKR